VEADGDQEASEGAGGALRAALALHRCVDRDHLAPLAPRTQVARASTRRGSAARSAQLPQAAAAVVSAQRGDQFKRSLAAPCRARPPRVGLRAMAPSVEPLVDCRGPAAAVASGITGEGDACGGGDDAAEAVPASGRATTAAHDECPRSHDAGGALHAGGHCRRFPIGCAIDAQGQWNREFTHGRLERVERTSHAKAQAAAAQWPEQVEPATEDEPRDARPSGRHRRGSHRGPGRCATTRTSCRPQGHRSRGRPEGLVEREDEASE